MLRQYHTGHNNTHVGNKMAALGADLLPRRYLNDNDLGRDLLALGNPVDQLVVRWRPGKISEGGGGRGGERGGGRGERGEGGGEGKIYTLEGSEVKTHRMPFTTIDVLSRRPNDWGVGVKSTRAIITMHTVIRGQGEADLQGLRTHSRGCRTFEQNKSHRSSTYKRRTTADSNT